MVNLVEPGDRMLVCVNGVFGGRMADVAERAGAQVTTIERPYGEVLDPGRGAAGGEAGAPACGGDRAGGDVDGDWQPLEEVAKVVREADAGLILVDAVTSLGGVPLEVDGWGLDAVYSGTQKCLR